MKLSSTLAIIVIICQCAINQSSADYQSNSITASGQKNEAVQSADISDYSFFTSVETLIYGKNIDILNVPLQIEDGVSSLELNYTLQDLFPSLAFLIKIRALANRMDVFPVDLIARRGEFCYYPYGGWTNIHLRTDLNYSQWKLFFSFCYLALHATDEDVEFCINALPNENPKVQALLLSVIYIHSYPWSDALIKYNLDVCDYSNNWSWLGKNIMCFQFNFKNSIRPDSECRQRYKSIISQYVSDDNIAFDKYELNHTQYQFPIRLPYTISNLNNVVLKSIEYEYNYAQTRKSLCYSIKEQYPDNYLSMISDILYIYFEDDLFIRFEGFGIGPRVGNASYKPKTVGQIASQLLESWAAPDPVKIPH